MKNYLLAAIVLVFFVQIKAQEKQNKLVGTKTCSMCHKTEKQGKQFDIWQKSKHANAYKELFSEQSIEIAKQKGLPLAASDSPECLSCHASGFGLDTTKIEKSFVFSEGVQCESCHGAGSNYKSIAIMKDYQKSVSAGMTDFKTDSTVVSSYCKNCHNEKSPTFKGFNFEEYWDKIKHPMPAK